MKLRRHLETGVLYARLPWLSEVAEETERGILLRVRGQDFWFPRSRVLRHGIYWYVEESTLPTALRAILARHNERNP